MKKIIAYFLNNSLLVNLISVLIIVVGLVSAFTLNKETFPAIDFDVILVRTSYPGSSSEDVEKLVTISLERQLKTVSGIRNLNAVSAEGSSIIYLEVDADEDIDDVLEDVKTAVDSTTDLPTEADLPTVTSLNNRRKGIINVAVFGNNYDEIRSASKKLRDKLERVTDVSSVRLEGYNPDQINIKVNPKKLNENELTLDEISNVVRGRNFNLSAGAIELSTGDVSIRTVAEFETGEDLKQLPIRSNDSGQAIFLSDIASIHKHPDPKAILLRSQGERSVLLNIKMKERGDIIATVDEIKTSTEDFFKAARYENLRFNFVDDLSYYVKRRLNILSSNGAIGILLVFCCLLLFLNFSTSVITSLGAPIAFLTAFIVMNYMGVSLNLISMFGLILVLGMLVDDSIIVAEQFYQKIEAGKKPKEAAYEAAIETIKPVSATILTTVIAFGSIFFMGGIMGKFLALVPTVVIICLAASWIECFFILPAHLKDFCSIKQRRVKKSFWFDRIKSFYSRIISRCLDYPKTVVLSFVVIFVLSLALGRTMKFELFPGDDVRIVFLQIKGPVGSPIEQTDSSLYKLEQLALALPNSELKQIKAQVGTLVGEHGNKLGSHYGSLVLYLTPPVERDRTTDDIITQLTTDAERVVPNYDVTVRKIQGGPPKGKPVEVEITGNRIDELKVVSKRIQDELKSIEGVTSTEIDFEEGKSQIAISVNTLEARRLGLTSIDVARELRRAFAKDVITEIRESDEDIDIKLMLDDESRSKRETLNLLYIKNRMGQRIPLLKLVSIKEKPGAFVIRRKNRKRIFSVSGTLDKEITTPLKIAKLLESKVDQFSQGYPEVDIEFSGENKDTNESMVRLATSGAISMVSILFVLILMFASFGQPIVIMSAIPLGMIGVIISFKIFGLALGFMALMGVVALIGVVVNDSIVLVNFINIKANEIEDLKDAIVKACESRLRPVILTTVTTVAGLLPVAHAPNGDPFLRPMALSFAYGLLFATFVTLVFVPNLYLVYRNILSFFERVFSKRRVSNEEVLP
jgi:multidrug efflux pump subunit AcrB